MELEKLAALRNKLVSRRRALVDRLYRLAPEQLTGDAIVRIQSAIEAVDRAIEEEARAASGRGVSRVVAAGPSTP